MSKALALSWCCPNVTVQVQFKCLGSDPLDPDHLGDSGGLDLLSLSHSGGNQYGTLYRKGWCLGGRAR